MMKSLSPFALLYEEENIGPISQLAFSSHGLLAISCKGAKIWDISSGKLPNDSLVAFDGAYMAAIALSPDGSRIAIGQENSVVIFDIATATRVQEHRHNGEARVLAWSPDGSLMASCSEHGHYEIWQVETGEVVKEQTFELAPLFLLWLPDQRLVMNPFVYPHGSSMWQAQLWKSAQTEVEYLIDDGERRYDDYTCAAMSPTSVTLALGLDDGFVQLWQIAPGMVPHRQKVLSFHMNTVQGLAWSPDGTYLASGAADGHVAVWSEQGEMLFHTGSRRSGDMGIRDVAWWNDVLAVADDTGRVAFYHVPSSCK